MTGVVLSFKTTRTFSFFFLFSFYLDGIRVSVMCRSHCTRRWYDGVLPSNKTTIRTRYFLYGYCYNIKTGTVTLTTLPGYSFVERAPRKKCFRKNKKKINAVSVHEGINRQKRYFRPITGAQQCGVGQRRVCRYGG